MSERLLWVVGKGDGTTVEELLSRAKVDASAVGEGRVFVGRKRVESGTHRIVAGDMVTVSRIREEAGAWQWIHRDADLAVVDKPAGMPTVADASGRAHSLQAQVEKSLGLAAQALHATSRLDLDVSGVVAFAITTRGRGSLAQLRQEGRYERRYVALTVGCTGQTSGIWTNPIGRARDPKLRMVDGKEATHAETRYAVIAQTGSFAMLVLEPVTGRTHQLRVHASHASLPLLGDRAYGGKPRATLSDGRVLTFNRVVLHAARVTLLREEPLILSAPIPLRLRQWWDALGGAASAWDQALTYVFSP